MRNGAFTYRALRSDEWQLARSLRLTALRDSPDAFLGTMAQAELMDAADWRSTFDTGMWFVAEASDRPIALTKASVLSGTPHEFYLESVWVHRSHRRSGVLRGLLRAIGREAYGRQATALRLAVLHTNARAQSIFLGLGFAPAGEPDAGEQQLVIDVDTLINPE